MDLEIYPTNNNIGVYKFPFSDKNLNKIMNVDFYDFLKIKTVGIAKHNDYADGNYDFDNEISLEEFIDQYLTPEQQERIHEYIYNGIEEVTNRFFNPVNMKSAATYQ